MPRARSADLVPTIRTAAHRVLARSGPAGVTIRAVANEADVSAQSIYNRFRTRDALLDDVATAGYRALTAAMLGSADQRLTTIADPLHRLNEVFRRYRATALAEPHVHRFLFDEPMPWRSHRTREAATEPFGLAVATTRLTLEAGLILPGDPRELASRIWAVADGTVRLELACAADRLPATVDAEAILATVIRGLRPGAQLR